MAFVVDLRGLGEVFAGEGAQVVEGFAERVAFGEVGFDREGAHTVVAVQRIRVREFLEGHEIGERDEFVGAGGSHKNVFERGGSSLAVAVAFDDDIVFLAVV